MLSYMKFLLNPIGGALCGEKRLFRQTHVDKYIFVAGLSLLLFISGCSTLQDKPLQIAVSKASPNYIKWLKKGDSTLIPVNLYNLPVDSALKELRKCSGLLVTGGEDIQPDLYGKKEEITFCTETDPARDTLEMALIRMAIKLKIPVMGICRGEQMLNVALGGTLIIDIPGYKLQSSASSLQSSVSSPQSSVFSLPAADSLHQMTDYLKCFHPVNVLHNTILYSIVKCDTGIVTSNHHQAVETPAPDLQINVKAFDGIAEGVEWKEPEGKSFLLGVQWHPERMDTANALSGKLLKQFIFQTHLFGKQKSDNY
jgi:putative glutamine amidotransferase